jgi:hypothetical protein
MVVCYLAGPAPILRDPVHPTIPYGYIPKSSPAYPCARPDKQLNSCDGSELFIVEVWSLDQSSPVSAPAENEGTSDCDTTAGSSYMTFNTSGGVCAAAGDPGSRLWHLFNWAYDNTLLMTPRV